MKRSLLLLSILCIFLGADAQKPEELLGQLAKQSPIEKAYLHFDRDNYLAGETAWFKAYLYSDYQPDTISSVLYVELLNESSVLISRKVLPVLLGCTNGQIELPDSLITGTYFIRAYSPTMLNNGIDFIYKKDIFIFGKKDKQAVANKQDEKSIQLEFFPEGGNLVEGLMNTIAFKATDEKGIPVAVRGTISNNKNEKITSFSSYHDGMGMFELIPQAGLNYFASFEADVTAKKYSLPDITANGVTLTMIPHPQGIFFEIRQRVTDPSMRAAYMIGQMQHHVVFRQELASGKNEIQGVVNTEKLNSGILQITVFNKEGIPLAERLCFVNNKEYIQKADLRTDTLSFLEKGRNHFKIVMKDTVQGNLSVSITDADYSLATYRRETIFSNFLLTSDLRGDINNPAWYFSSDEDSVKTALDLVMMTNGWRRFRWNELAQKVKNPLNYSDPSYITITGKVTMQGSNRPFAEKPMVAIISAEGMSRNFQMINTDKNGFFKLDSLVFFGNGRIFILDIRGKRSQFIDVKLSGDTAAKIFSLPVGTVHFPAKENVSPAEQNKLTFDFDAIQKEKGILLEDVIINVKKKSATDELNERYTRGLFSGEAVRTIDMVNTSDIVVQNNIFDYLQSRVPGLSVVEPDYSTSSLPSLENPFDDPTGYRLYYRQGPSASSLGNIPMVIYLDEIETSSAVVATIPANQIAMIKVFSFFAAAPGGGSGGALAIYTKKGQDIKNSSRGDLISYKGFSVVKEFYAPNYKAEPELLSKGDSRITLDWRPNIFINNVNPVIPVSFYNSDRTKKFRVVVEGMTTSGKMISLEKIIEAR